MYLRSRAPLRISFGGGGTDLPEYARAKGGCVLSTTINRYAYFTMSKRRRRDVSIQSLDYGIKRKYHLERKVVYDGELDLIKAGLKRFGVRGGLDLFIHCDTPPGSGLASSSAMAVAMAGGLAAWKKDPLTPYEIAETAYRIEREELGIRCGMQDQHAAAFGGFNFIEFEGDTVIVNPLRIPRRTLHELHYTMILCYTGRTRLSGDIIRRQTKSFTEGKRSVVGALDRIKDLAIAMKSAILRDRIREFGDLLHQSWLAKRRLDDKISSGTIDDLYETARRRGAIGGKILGAGGGGHLVLLCDFARKHKVAEAVEDRGAKVVPFAFEDAGLQVWEAE